MPGLDLQDEAARWTCLDPLLMLRQWIDDRLPLQQRGGLLGLGIWDYDPGVPAGPQDIWVKTAKKALGPDYVGATDGAHFIPAGRWMGAIDLEKGMKALGLRDMAVERCDVGLNLGTEGIMQFFWESDNPTAVVRRKGRPEEQIERLKKAMREVLVDEYEDGMKVPLWTALAVGRK